MEYCVKYVTVVSAEFIIVLATKAVLSKNRYKEREIKEQLPRITDKGMQGPSEYFL